MKTKQILIVLLLVSSVFTSRAQQIGDGWAPVIPNFGDILQSGVYNGYKALGGLPDNSNDGWQHLLVIRHPNTTNNNQFQMGTSCAENDRLFFRKISSGLTPRSPNWIELATRGSNNFVGDQNINGNVGIGNLSPTYKLDIQGVGRNVGIHLYKTDAVTASWYLHPGRLGTGEFSIGNDNFYALTILPNGNVGIGTTDPKNCKLAVEGTIGAREVVVLAPGTAWPDYVFNHDYKLRSLEEIERYVSTEKHLPDVPSAEAVAKDGVNLGEMNAILLKKVEELTLHLIDQSKENALQRKEIDDLKLEMTSLKR